MVANPWEIPFDIETWNTVWQGFSAVGTVGTLAYTLKLYRHQNWTNQSAEARKVITWVESPGAETNDGVHTYHSTFQLLNQSSSPIHDVAVRIVLPTLKDYLKRRKAMPHTDAPEYTEQQWTEPVGPLNDMVRLDWGVLDGGLRDTVVPGESRSKRIATPVPARCVDVLVEFLHSDGHRWQKNASTGKLKLLD